MSPFEHQASPDYQDLGHWLNRDRWGNLYGWIQHRKIIDNESVIEWF
jgi:hypothetical protein